MSEGRPQYRRCSGWQEEASIAISSQLPTRTVQAYKKTLQEEESKVCFAPYSYLYHFQCTILADRVTSGHMHHQLAGSTVFVCSVNFVIIADS